MGDGAKTNVATGWGDDSRVSTSHSSSAAKKDVSSGETVYTSSGAESTIADHSWGDGTVTPKTTVIPSAVTCRKNTDGYAVCLFHAHR
jgi:hypothetical protein